MTQSIQEQGTGVPALTSPSCPKCGGPVRCSCKDVGGVSYEDEYTLTCPTCGVVGCQSVYGGSFSADYDTSTSCPFCKPGYVCYVDRSSPSPAGRIDRIRVSIALDLSTLQLGDERDRRVIIRICELTAPEDITPEALLEAAAKIFIRFRSTRSWDDNCYWCGQSPFNSKWYVFAQDFGRPAFVSDQYPAMMDE